MRSVSCCLLCCLFTQSAWAINIKVQSRVLPRCTVSDKAVVLTTAASICSRSLNFVRTFKRTENSGASAVERVVMEF
ncbi:hypothetical protein EV682_10350 [Iodobacter fluviatilis]|uniref:Secreted protein n=1 Tax=Iodobacter fluviatilis TaxID=537 RepID=A0A377Q996_9NEIS|nr:hypothetical protein EV682_10350 [Iodobacter fluviatilis]STQ91462.1 Uncharacterised protein [Iodobacter fluviatilis]